MPFAATEPGHAQAAQARQCSCFMRGDGEFVWHTHDDTDELFSVFAGVLTIQLRIGDVRLSAGELFVVREVSSTGRSRQGKCTRCSSSRRVSSIPAMQVAD